MPFMHGLGGYVASRGQHWDGVLGLSDAFFACRENTVSQKFERRLAAIDFKVKRQELHRDDIKNLVDLTTSRLEMYHLVGALLLTASIEWLADAHFTAGVLPSETILLANLLFISNISAIGYLILCVWFTMYAAIASKSIGTRLLVNYARLSLPTADELNSIKAPIFFNAGDALRRGFGRSSSEPDLNACGEEQTPSEDTQQHLRRFLLELPRWFVYDTWSRVCLSFGLAQMLQAMSYFTLGVFWPAPGQPDDRWFLAIFAFSAVRMLTGLMLWVDFSDFRPATLDYAFIVGTEILGPVLFIGILTEASTTYEAAEARGETYWMLWSAAVAIVFVAHAAWLTFIVFRFDLAPMPGMAKGPHTFQAINFAHVLEWVSPAPAPGASSETLASKMIARVANRPRRKSVDDDLLRRSVSERIVHEIDAEDRSRSNEVNGGREPGTWMSYDKEDPNFFREDLDRCKGTDWLPVKATRYFSVLMVVWWIIAGMVHTLIAEIETVGYFRPDSMALIPLNTSLDFEAATSSFLVKPGYDVKENVAAVQWPEPFFKVTSLYCSDSRLWVSNGFSVFAVGQHPHGSGNIITNPSKVLKLTVVKDGPVGTIFCRGHHRSCHGLVKNVSNRQGESNWQMDTVAHPSHFRSPVPSKYRTWARVFHPAAVGISVPDSWRLVTASWTSCTLKSDADCVAASLAGWDGTRIFIALLQKDDSGDLPWAVHTRYELEPAHAVCADGFAGCRAHGAGTYEDVKALDLSSNGDVLTVLRHGGVVDEWNLPSRMLKRWHLDANYTSMCRSGERMFLSRDGDAGPVLTITKTLRSFDESPPSSVAGNLTASDASGKQRHRKTHFRHSFLHNRARTESDFQTDISASFLQTSIVLVAAVGCRARAVDDFTCPLL